MYNSDVVRVEAHSNRVEAVWQEAKKLSPEEKAELVQRMLRKDSGLVVVSKHTRLVDYIIVQMTLLSSEGLARVARAISSRIASEVHSSGS
jgi:hypothetical protein